MGHQEWSRGQVVREALHEVFKRELRLAPEQIRRLSRELIVRRRRPVRNVTQVFLDGVRNELFPRRAPVMGRARA
jgi:hypothetical protein